MSDDYLISIVARLRDETSAGLDNLKRKIEDLKAQSATSDLSSGVSDLADEADRAAKSHEDLAKQQEAHRRATEQSRATQIQQGKYLAEGAEQAGAQAESLGQINEEHETLRRQAPQTEASLRRVGEAHGVGDRAAAQQAASTSDLRSAMDDAAQSTDKLSAAQQRASQRGNELIQKMGELDQAARSHTASNRELEVGYRQLTSGLRSVWREMDVGSEAAGRFGSAMEDAESKAKNTDFARASSGFAQFAQKISAATDGIMPKIVSLSAELRGLRLIFDIGTVQPMITGLDSLAAGFFSVASGAAQAAATIGGVFISGMGQLMPVMSVAIAGFEGLKNVLQAVQAVSAEQQANYLAPNQGMINELSTTNALVEAEENLKNAYVQVREAQEQLLESTLQITQARQALVVAEHSGSQMAIEEARLQLQQAQTARREALVSVSSARQGVPEAQRQLQIEQLTAAEPTSYESEQQATVQYLESLMSPIEKQLFEQLSRMDLELKQPGSPLNKIASDFLAPFMNISTRLQSLLSNQSFLSPIYKLAQAMKKAGDSMTETVFGSGGTSFFTTMADDATKSIPILTKSLEGFLKLLGDIATAAAPAFDKLSKDWASFWTGLASKEGSAAGQQRLTAFFDKGATWAQDFAHLARSIVDLFMALGHDAAPQGMDTVTSLSGTVQAATSWVQSHGQQVTQFFAQAEQGLSVIGSTLIQVGKLLVQVFSLSSLRAFSSLITGLILPGLKDFIDVVGKLVNLFMELLGHLGPLRQILEAGIGVAFALTAFGRLVGVVTRVVDVIAGVKDGMVALRAGEGILNSLGAAWSAFTTRITKGKTAINDVKTAQDELATTTATTDTEMGAEDEVLWEKIATEGVGAEGEEAAAGAGGMGLAGMLSTGAIALGGIGTGLLGARVLSDSNGNLLKAILGGAGTGAGAGALAGLPFGGPIGSAIGAGAGALAGGTAGAITSLLGLFGGTGVSDVQKAQAQIKQLGDNLKNFGSVLDIPTSKLKKFYDQAQQLLGEGDITASQRAALDKLSQSLDPVLVKVEKIQSTWASTFSGISALTGNVMSQVSQTLNQRLGEISVNMGTQTQSGVAALQGSIVGAVSTVMQNTSKMVRDTSSKMSQLNTVLSHALKALGINVAPNVLSHLDLPQIEAISKDAYAGGHIKITTLAQALAAVDSGTGSAYSPTGDVRIAGGAATGAWHEPTPGGKLTNVGEGGYPEVTLTTDPRHAARSGALLGRYLQSMAVGGSVTFPQVSGVGGIPGILAQGDVDLVGALGYGAITAGMSGGATSTPASTSASSPLSTIISGASSAISGIKNGSWYTVASQIAKKMGWGSSEVTAWQGVESLEDGFLSLTAKNPGSDAYGLAQFIDGPGEYYRYGGNPNTIVGQLTAMANYIKERYGSPAGALNHERMYHWYARGGIIGDHIRRIGLRHLRRKILHMASGGRAPWGGDPVPIVAHEGEHVVNPGQWSHIAGLTGMSGSQLDDHMGYNSDRPRQFAGGGTVPFTSTQGASSPAGAGSLSSLSAVNAFLTKGVSQAASWTLDFTGVSSALGALDDLFTALNKGLSLIGTIGGADTTSKITKLTTLIGNFADPNQTDSALNSLNTAFESFQNNVTSWLTNASYLGKTLSASRIARVNLSTQTGGRGGNQTIRPSSYGTVSGSGDDLRMLGPTLNAGNAGHTGDAAIDLLTERSYSQQYQYLGTENKSVQDAINKVKSSISQVQASAKSAPAADKEKYTKSLNDLEQSYSELVQQQQNLSTNMASLVSTRFETEQQYVQDTVNQINDIYQTQQTQLQGKQAGLESMGNYGKLPSIDQSIANSATAQIKALQAPLEAAKQQNDADAVAQIKQQIAELQETVTQSVAQMIQDAISGIQQTAQTQQAQVSMQQTIAQTMQSAATTPGQFAAAGSLNLQALTSNQGFLQGQLSQYNTLLGQAVSTGNVGAQNTILQQIDSLTAELSQNTQAIQDNTAQTVSQTAAFIQSQGQFQTGSLGTLSQIITTIGQTTGFTDVGALKQLATASNTSLQGTNQGLLAQLAQLGSGPAGLASLLTSAGGGSNPAAFASAMSSANLGSVTSGMDATQLQTFDTLIQDLESNTSAIATNNEQLAQLNGQLLQPQQWSSSSWTALRSAIFSGMGNLLPGYQSVLTGTSAAPTIAPTFSPVATPNASPTIGTMNINHVPASSVQPPILGQQMAHQASLALA